MAFKCHLPEIKDIQRHIQEKGRKDYHHCTKWAQKTKDYVTQIRSLEGFTE